MKELIVYRFEEYIDAPIEVVFSYIDEDDKIKCWNTMLVDNIYDSEEDMLANKPGTTFTSISKIEKKTIESRATLREHEAPYRVVVDAKTKEGISKSTYQLSRDGKGTWIVVEVSLIASNIFYYLLMKMLGWTTKFIYDEQFNRLKTYVEEVEY